MCLCVICQILAQTYLSFPPIFHITLYMASIHSIISVTLSYPYLFGAQTYDHSRFFLSYTLSIEQTFWYFSKFVISYPFLEHILAVTFISDGLLTRLGPYLENIIYRWWHQVIQITAHLYHTGWHQNIEAIFLYQ